jgi:hypothetical protein
MLGARNQFWMYNHKQMQKATLIAAWGSLFFCLQAHSRTPALYSPDQIRSALIPALGSREASHLVIPFEADEKIRSLAFEITKEAESDSQKLSFLLHYFKEQGFLERYDQNGTKTAIEVMKSGQGNCLSYANLFVALARSVGLQAFYMDGSAVNNETDHRQGLLVDYGHVLVGVRVGPNLESIDFDGEKKDPKRYQILSDLEAVADYYNNVGFERSRLGGGEQTMTAPEVIHAFSLASRICPGFARAWNNLGVALKKKGDPDAAANAYRNAARADPNLPAPHANLGHLWMSRNEIPAAIGEFQKAVERNPDNAHYHCFLAAAFAKAGILRRALEELQAARELDKDNFAIQLELSRMHLKLNHREEARVALQGLFSRFPNHPEVRRLLAEINNLDSR